MLLYSHAPCHASLTTSLVLLQQYWAKNDQAHSYITCQEMAAAFEMSSLGKQSQANLRHPFQETKESDQVRLSFL